VNYTKNTAGYIHLSMEISLAKASQLKADLKRLSAAIFVMFV
jgi:hypothetical protein